MKKLKNIILTFILTFTMVFVVKAEGKYSIDVETTHMGDVTASLNMTFNFDPADYEMIKSKDITYFVKFVNESDPKPENKTYDEIIEEIIDNDGYINEYHKVILEPKEEEQNYHAYIQISEDWYMLAGYTKAYVIKCIYDSDKIEDVCEVLDEPIILEKPALPKLSQRYHNYAFGDSDDDIEPSLSAFRYFPDYGPNGDHELNVKIGLINDEDLLRRLARNESGSLEMLMEYAKKANGTIFTDIDLHFEVSLKGHTFVEGAYYYMYTYYTNKDGLYRNLDDIAVAMGKNNYIINDVDWSRYDTTSLWDEFIKKYKETDVIKNYKEEDVSVDIESSNTTLRSTIDDGTVKLVGNFDYKDGVVSYVPLDDKEVNFETIRNEDVLVENAIVALANLKGIDSKKLKTWLYENEGKLSLDKYGIEYTLEDYTKKQDNGVSLTVEKVKSFKFKLDSELKLSTIKVEVLNTEEVKPTTSKTENKKPENPKTGINLGYTALLGLVVLGGTAYLYTRKKSKFPKHN